MSLKDQIQIFIILFIVYLIVSILVVLNSQIGFNSGIINVCILLIIILVTAYLTYKNILFGFVILGAVLLYQPLLTAFLADYLNSSNVRIFIALKELVSVILLFILLSKNFNKIKLIFVDYSLILFILFYLIYFFISGAPLFLRIISLREGMMIFVFYSIGRLALFSDLKLYSLTKYLITIGLFAALFGLIERFIFSQEIWSLVGGFKYVGLKYDIRFNEHGFISNWYTYVTNDIQIRRIVGTILEPTSFSRVIAFLALLALYSKKIFSYLNKNLFLYFLFLAFVVSIGLSRGGFIILVIGIIFYIHHKSSYITYFLVPVIAILLLNTSLFSLDSANATRHFAGLFEGIDASIRKPFGHGLGASGQLAVLYGDLTGDERVSESFIGGVGYQLGVLGILLYSLFFISLLRYLYLNKFVSKTLVYLCFSSSLAIYLTSFLSNSAVAPISSGFILIYSGICISKINERLI